MLIDEFKDMQKKNMILVSEMGGTYDVQNDRDDTIGITTWFNERYVKDCSKKQEIICIQSKKRWKINYGELLWI